MPVDARSVVRAQSARNTRTKLAEKTGAVVKMDGNERTLVDIRIGARKVYAQYRAFTRNIAHLRAFTVVDFHVLPRYHAPCTGARARVIAQNIAYHFTRADWCLVRGFNPSTRGSKTLSIPLKLGT